MRFSHNGALAMRALAREPLLALLTLARSLFVDAIGASV